MRVSFDFLSVPLRLVPNKATVLCIENKSLFRKTIAAFYNNTPEDENIIFSQNFNPFKVKGNVCFVADYYDLKLSSAVMKKLYDMMARFCNNELISETLALKTDIMRFFDLIVQNFDFDFSYSLEFSLTDLFKMQDLKPELNRDDLLHALLDFLILIRQYADIKVFVLLNLHLYFDAQELQTFYKEVTCQDIVLLVLENDKTFTSSVYESVTIIDNDLCEILEN